MTGGPQPCSAATRAATKYSAYTEDEIASAYDMSPALRAPVTRVQASPWRWSSSSRTLDRRHRLRVLLRQGTATVTYTEEDGGATGCGWPERQRAGGRTRHRERHRPGARRPTIDVFQAPNSNTGLIDDYTAIVDDPR